MDQVFLGMGSDLGVLWVKRDIYFEGNWLHLLRNKRKNQYRGVLTFIWDTHPYLSKIPPMKKKIFRLLRLSRVSSISLLMNHISTLQQIPLCRSWFVIHSSDFTFRGK